MLTRRCTRSTKSGPTCTEKQLKTLTGLLCGLLLIPVVSVAGHPAEDLVRNLTGDLISTLEDPRSKVDAEFLDAALQRDVLPHIDFTLMTKLAVGKHWRDASKEQKQALVDEFRDLLVNTYTRALNEYSGQEMAFLPFKPGKREDRAVVNSIFKDGSVQFPVDYKLREKGKWLIYDIEVESISLVLGYRSEFGSQIGKNGIDGLIAALQKKNQ